MHPSDEILPMEPNSESAAMHVNRASRTYPMSSISGSSDTGVVALLEEGAYELTEKVDQELSEIGPQVRSRRKVMWDRFRGAGRRKVGWIESIRNTVTSSGA